jgi:hypothetical protein
MDPLFTAEVITSVSMLIESSKRKKTLGGIFELKNSGTFPRLSWGAAASVVVYPSHPSKKARKGTKIIESMHLRNILAVLPTIPIRATIASSVAWHRSC